ncbi:MAG: AmmeMemoRadiSam system protein B [Candidatus Omnitrophica bacterium]|nr:AmmeMemoRadiSam system protein B [Candidatus Omnitrophota bacterium]
MDRIPAGAGIFYPEEPRALSELIEGWMNPRLKKEPLIAALIPHGGDSVCGRIAGQIYSRLQGFEAVVILGAKHTQRGAPFAVVSCGAWETPLGKLKVHEPLARAILEEADPILVEDPSAHEDEHSVEWQLLFVRRLKKRCQFVPVVLGEGGFPDVERLGLGLSRAVRRIGAKTLLVASSNLSRYEPPGKAARDDRWALDRIEALDPEGLLEEVQARSVSMCGVAAVAGTLVAARALGARRASRVGYEGVSPIQEGGGGVVGYAGVVFQ